LFVFSFRRLRVCSSGVLVRQIMSLCPDSK
jgi:hypothetical protein